MHTFADVPSPSAHSTAQEETLSVISGELVSDDEEEEGGDDHGDSVVVARPFANNARLVRDEGATPFLTTIPSPTASSREGGGGNRVRRLTLRSSVASMLGPGEVDRALEVGGLIVG
jgi:hypothetical protein